MGKYMTVFDAKPQTTMEQILKERKGWVAAGKESALEKRCSSIQRFETIGKSPLRVVFIIDTDDPLALTELSMHFGDAWDSITHPIVERKVSEILTEDTAVTYG